MRDGGQVGYVMSEIHGSVGRPIVVWALRIRRAERPSHGFEYGKRAAGMRGPGR